MLFFKICEAEATNAELTYQFKELAKIVRRYAAVPGFKGEPSLAERRIFQGQSKKHMDTNALYLRVEDPCLRCLPRERTGADGSDPATRGGAVVGGILG